MYVSNYQTCVVRRYSFNMFWSLAIDHESSASATCLCLNLKLVTLAHFSTPRHKETPVKCHMCSNSSKLHPSFMVACGTLGIPRVCNPSKPLRSTAMLCGSLAHPKTVAPASPWGGPRRWCSRWPSPRWCSPRPSGAKSDQRKTSALQAPKNHMTQTHHYKSTTWWTFKAVVFSSSTGLVCLRRGFGPTGAGLQKTNSSVRLQYQVR